MKYADLTPGRVIELGPTSLSEQQILDFARSYDPQWFHTDVARAAASPWEGVIASGWQTCAAAMRLVVEHVLNGSESFGSPGLGYLKWEAPVRPGDRLRVRLDVLDRRTSSRKPTLGIVRWRWQVFNQRDEGVLDLEATSFFDLQDSGFSANARA